MKIVELLESRISMSQGIRSVCKRRKRGTSVALEHARGCRISWLSSSATRLSRSRPVYGKQLDENRKVFDAIGFLDVDKWAEAGSRSKMLGGGKAAAFQLVEASDEAA